MPDLLSALWWLTLLCFAISGVCRLIIRIGEWLTPRPIQPPQWSKLETPVPPSPRARHKRARPWVNQEEPPRVGDMRASLLPRPPHVNCRCTLDFRETPAPHPKPVTLLVTCTLCKTMHGVAVPDVMTLEEKRALLFQNSLCKKCKN